MHELCQDLKNDINRGKTQRGENLRNATKNVKINKHKKYDTYFS